MSVHVVTGTYCILFAYMGGFFFFFKWNFYLSKKKKLKNFLLLRKNVIKWTLIIMKFFFCLLFMFLPFELLSMQGDCGAVQCWCGRWNAMEVCSHTKRGSSFYYTHTYKHKNAHAHSLTPTYSIPNLLIHLKMH